MFAQCSNCDSIFRVTRKQLDAHDGLVRCGRCREVFNAAWNLVDQLTTTEASERAKGAGDASLARSVNMAAAVAAATKRAAKPPIDGFDEIEELAASIAGEPDSSDIKETPEYEQEHEPEHKPKPAPATRSEQIATEPVDGEDDLDSLETAHIGSEDDQEQHAQKTTGNEAGPITQDEELEVDGIDDNILGEWAPAVAADQLQLNFGDTEPAGVYLREKPDSSIDDVAENITGILDYNQQEAIEVDEEDSAKTDIQALDDDEPETAGTDDSSATSLTAAENDLRAADETSQTAIDAEDIDDRDDETGFATIETASGDLADEIEHGEITFATEKSDDMQMREPDTDIASESVFGPEVPSSDLGVELDDLPDFEESPPDSTPGDEYDNEDDLESGIKPHAWRPDPLWRDIDADDDVDDVTTFTQNEANRDFDELPSLYNGDTSQEVEPVDENDDFEHWDDQRTPMLGSTGDNSDPEHETPVLIAQEWYDGDRQEPRLEPVVLEDQDDSDEFESAIIADTHEDADDLTQAGYGDNELDQESEAENFSDASPEPVVRIIDESVSEPDELPEQELRTNRLYDDSIERLDDDYADAVGYADLNNDTVDRQVISDLDPEHTGPFNPNDVDWVVLHGRNPLRTALWGIGCVLLIGTLIMQVRSVHFDQLAAVPELRPYLVSFCNIAACDVPARRDARRIELSQTRVTLHPENPGALRIAASLTNLAAFAQPFPSLQLTLTDKSGRIVGRRVYQPIEYLGTDSAASSMPTATPQDVILDLAQPHETAVGFELAIAH